MAISVQKRDEQLWSGVLELTKLAQEKNGDPLLWAVQVSSRLNSSGELLPSPELAHVLVSHICWDNHVPVTWKFLEKALALNIAPALLVLALLSSRVVPNRQIHPSAYRLFLELLKKYAFRLSFQINGPDYHKILKSIDDVLHLSQISGLQACESGLRLVEFVFSTVVRLLDASIEDEGLMELATEGRSTWSIGSQNMEIDGQDCFDENRNENNEVLHKVNVTLAIEIIGKFLQNRKTSRLLYLASQNMPLHWADFIQRLRLLAADSASFRNLKTINLENLLHLTYDTSKVLSLDGKRMKQKGFHAAMSSGLLFSHVASRSEVWLPIDMLLEDAVNGVQVVATGALQRLTCLVKSLQAVNDTSWHNTFLGLWIASLRLVQRERDPSEGPVPRLDTCLCMLLSITTLVVTNIIEEEEGELMEEAERMPINQRKEKGSHGRRRGDLVTSLQQLGDYKGLLTPPQSINSVANQAALKAMMFVSGMAVGDGHYDCVNVNDVSLNCSGNLRHLIVEACIARNLLDTSAYFWPGYVNASSNQLPCNVTGQVAGWSSLVKGAPLTPAMVNALVATPASSLAEIEKIYEIAINGSDDEKISAVTILCGASLVCGWNVQEHIALFITRFLSPPAPADYTGTESYLISCAPFLNVLLLGISSVDCVHIFSLHGLVPLLAGQLMPICEAFGSTASNASQTSTTGEVLASHAVFSNAFTLLLRLWRFDHPPLDHLNGDGPPVGSQRSPEYLLLVRNSMLASFGSSPKDRLKARRMSKLLSFPLEPIFMDHFPKLKRWYRQHQECIASILSSLVPGTPVHQMVDALLSMMFRKIKKDGQPSTPTTSGSSNSSGSVITDETFGNLKVPAWDILEAIPFVLDAALTAIAHGRLSPRELATGLKDLADFLPASLAPIVSYLSAEVTRGIWKPAFMNGTDWPSPAANLLSVEQQIKKILAATGVNVPSLPAGGSSPATLPLPLAALVSFTITYKLDKASERFLTVVGPALSALAVGCPWPSMPILTSLWTKKVKRWSDFLIFSASRTVFHHNNYAVVQLLKSCFTSALGLNTSLISSDGGVGDLLGHGFGSHFSGGISPVAPGILYLRVHPAVKNPFFLADEIVSLLILSVGDIATSGLPPKEREDRPNASKSGATSSYRQVSLGKAMTRVKLAASLGASLVWLSGGFSLVQSLIKETLPSWFISVHSEKDSVGDFAGMVAMLRGYALAYFAMLSGAFAWGVDSGSAASKRRAYILSAHLEFVASALEGKISLGCNQATWKSYVSGFISLLVVCMPTWVREVNVDVLNRLSNELWRINEEDLALALLGRDGIRSVDVATQLILSGS